MILIGVRDLISEINCEQMEVMNLFFSLFWIYHHVSAVVSSALPDTIMIGGLFEGRNKGVEVAFRNTMEKINLRSDILSQSLLIYNTADVNYDDSFEASKKVCKMVKDGVAAIFGPSSQLSSGHVQSICNTLSIPHIQTHWDSRGERDYFSLSLFPHYEVLGNAYVDIIKYWEWKAFTVIYDDNDGVLRLQEVLKFSKGLNVKVTVRKLDPDPQNWVYMFKEMIEKQETRMIIDCDVSKVGTVLHKASLVSIVNEYHHYMFTSLDLGLVDLENYKYGGANITAFRLVDPANPKVVAVTEDWVFEELNNRESPLQGQRQIPTEVALMYDGVFLASLALHEVGKAKVVTTDKELSCSKTKSWADGLSVLNYMKTMDFEGLTGRVHFENGQRKDFHLDVIELSKNGLVKIGTWNPKQKVNITKTPEETKLQVEEDLSQKTFRVVTKEDPPYVIRIKDRKPGEPEFEGFCIDLLNALKERLNFNYTITESDGYGQCKKHEVTQKVECTGLMKDLVEQKADLAVAGMTITFDREKYVDFTKPFLNLGITILFKKPEPEPPQLFSFLDPLSSDVWIYLVAGFLCVSFMLFVIARFTPYEWVNPHPCNQDTDEVENQFTILNSLWFTIGALMQQGSEIAPQAISTRMVSCCWWFFTLIIISSYTANLAAFLTVERMVAPIESVEDLAKQSVIKYGTQKDSSTKRFFEDSNKPIFNQMSVVMNSNADEVYVGSNKAGKDKVEAGNYAFFAESTYVEYVISRHCDLMQVGGLLDTKGYGIALPSDSKWRDKISSEILNLQEQQKIAEIKETWWKKKHMPGEPCTDAKKTTTASLSIKNVGGVFVVLAGGVAGGFLVAMCEFIYKARKNAREDKQSLCSEMAEEFRFALTCFGKSKKTNKRKHSSDITDNGIIQTSPMIRNNYGGPNKEYYA